MKDCQMDRPSSLSHRLFPQVGRRPRRGLMPAVRPLEGRRLLTGGPPAAATMSQTVTFPDLESMPNVSDQAALYFSATMGTLTEVDVVTSGSFTSQVSAENAASTGQTVQATTSAKLSIDVPTGALPVVIPPVTQSVDVSAFGAQSTPTATSSSTPQTTVLTSPAALAAFTGHFRIPISVTGHAIGSVTPNNGSVSASFHTDTSATITIIYHYIPNLPGTGPSPGTSSPGGTNASPNGVAGGVQALSGTTNDSSARVSGHRALSKRMSHPHRPPHPIRHHASGQTRLSRHHGPNSKAHG